MSDTPLYISHCGAKSFWQKYEIFTNRVELHTLLGRIVVPLEQIEAVEVFPPVIKSLRLHLRDFRLGLKLDLIDFQEHVVLDKSTGMIHRIMFTPDDPAAFKRALDEAIAQFRKPPHG